LITAVSPYLSYWRKRILLSVLCYML